MTLSATSTASGGDMVLMPFIYVYGRAEEALEFYKAAIGGTYDIVARNEANGDPRLDPSFVGKISYATFAAPGISFALSDGAGPKTLAPGEGNITLSLRIPDAQSAERVFTALAEGGSVEAPFGEVPWGGKFGHVHDRFQNEWFILS